MKTKQSFLQGVLLSSILLLILTLGIEGDFIAKTFNNTNQQASLIRSIGVKNIYNISPSKNVPGTFNFNYVYAKSSINSKKEAQFDFPIIPFDEEKARAILEKEYGYVDFGPIRDAWGYPVRENAFMKSSQRPEETRRQSLNPFKIQKADAYDPDTNTPGLYNCRANTQITGYFKAHFEDVALDTNVGFDDPTFGNARREEACQVLEDMSELLMMDTTTVTPEILFTRSDQPLPPGALAAASSYFGYYTASPDNGALHKHIITRQDPTPAQGSFDALILTNWNGINWSVDSSLNENTYDFYTVMWHEMMHALGFRALLPAVIQADVEHSHGTFDYHTHEDETLQNRFITAITNLLNVPAGAPSPWFITNQVVYRGVKNILNAQPDGIRPIYSPTFWQFGSSLSHFDMGRANGEEYVMHPSISVNTDREIHEHEKEVLCHLGYQVEGLAGCEVPTPAAVDDLIELNGADPVCVNFLLNDLNPGGSISQLTLNDMQPVSLQPGDVVEYYQSQNCFGSMQSNPSGSVSMRIIPTADTSPRILKYTNRNINTNRVSFSASIMTIPSCESIMTDPDEYVCNGDFNASTPSPYSPLSQIDCSLWDTPGQLQEGYVLNVCQFLRTPDVVHANSSQSFVALTSPAPQNTDFPYLRHATMQVFNSGIILREIPIMKLKEPLVPGEQYVLSFDVAQKNGTPELPVKFVLLTTTPVGNPNNILPTPNQIIFNNSISSSNEWNSFDQTFTADNTYESVVFFVDGLPLQSGQSNALWGLFDNISIRRDGQASPPSGVSGTIYHDLNQNSSWQTTTESGLSGISVNLFEAGNTTPIGTVNTEDLPNQGKYQFTNLPDGDYYIALEGENIYPLITEPSSNNILPGYSHARMVNISNGQMVENQNFGVTLVGDPQPAGETDISVRKGLHDDTLTLIDRQITWRILVSNQGPQQATNVILEDIIPPGLVYVSHTTSDPTTTYNPLTGIYTIPTLNLTGQPVLDITMRVPLKLCGVRTNTIRLLSLDQIDINPDNDQYSSSINITSCLGVASSGKRF